MNRIKSQLTRHRRTGSLENTYNMPILILGAHVDILTVADFVNLSTFNLQINLDSQRGTFRRPLVQSTHFRQRTWLAGVDWPVELH